MEGITDEFWQERPTVSGINRQLLNTFWSLKRDAGIENTIKRRDILESLECVNIEPDIGLIIIQQIDDYHRELYISEMRRKTKK